MNKIFLWIVLAVIILGLLLILDLAKFHKNIAWNIVFQDDRSPVFINQTRNARKILISLGYGYQIVCIDNHSRHTPFTYSIHE